MKKYLGESVSFLVNSDTMETTQDLNTTPDDQFLRGKAPKVFTERTRTTKPKVEPKAEPKAEPKPAAKATDSIPQAKQVTDLERAIAKLAVKSITARERAKGLRRYASETLSKGVFAHPDGSLGKLKNVDVLLNYTDSAAAPVAWDGDNIVIHTKGKTTAEITNLLEKLSKRILKERKDALTRLQQTNIPTGSTAATLTPKQEAANQIAKSKALVDFYLKVKPLSDLQNVAPSMQHLIPLSKRMHAASRKQMPDLTKFETTRSDYQDYMLAWKMLQGSDIVNFDIDVTTNVYQQENLGKAHCCKPDRSLS